MKKVLSALVLVSSLVILATPVLLLPTIVSAATCPNCQSTTVNCTCGANVLSPEGAQRCYNGTVYETISACNAVMSGGTTNQGAGFQEAPTLITSGQGLLDLITRVGNWIFSILLGIAAIMLILAGFFWVTAAGNPEGVKRANDTLRNALIGIAIALGAKGLVLVIGSIVRG